MTLVPLDINTISLFNRYSNKETGTLTLEAFNHIINELKESLPVDCRVIKKNADGLLPCPFCGGEAEIVKNSFPPRNTERHPRCNTEGCIANIAEDDEFGGTNCDCQTDEEAIALWNKRASIFSL